MKMAFEQTLFVNNSVETTKFLCFFFWPGGLKPTMGQKKKKKFGSLNRIIKKKFVQTPFS